MKKLVLASESPRRKELLTMIGLSFRVAKSNVDEKFNPRLSPKKQAEELSRQKAEAVAKRFVEAVVIGADTIVVIDNEMLAKPVDAQDAVRMLKKLQGRSHSVITGYTIIDSETKKIITNSVETKVTFKKMSQKDVEWYVATNEPFDKAGGYAIQGKGSIFIEKIDGDFFNVVGLPMAAVCQDLERFIHLRLN